MQLTDVWQPSASLEMLQQRAALLRQLREFFYQRDVLEVDTPLLSRFGVTDIHLTNLKTQISLLPQQPFFLQTSPEYAMKRMLAAHQKSIYQLGKVFRDDEIGPRHNPEFTMLEWYRMDFDMDDLMAEVEQLLRLVLGAAEVEHFSYQAAFLHYIDLDPLLASVSDIQQCLQKYDAIAELAQRETDRDTLLQLAMAMVIEPQFPHHKMTFIYDFPASQAALAQLSKADERVAHRFEVYVGGIELANGYQELTDAAEQQQRFTQDQALRAQMGSPEAPADYRLIKALEHGFPQCSGVALGVDRLLMIATKKNHIKQVIPFDITCA